MTVSIRSWGMWMIIEALLIGGYRYAEQNLPPLMLELMPEMIPAPFQSLGWTALHALLQIVVWLGILAPLTGERFMNLYPKTEREPKLLFYIMTLHPVILVPWLVFLFWPRRLEDRWQANLPTSLLRFQGLGLGFLLVLPVILLQIVEARSIYLGGAPLAENSYMSTLSSSSRYVRHIADVTHKSSEIRLRIFSDPETHSPIDLRTREYEILGLEDPTALILALAIEINFLSKKKSQLVTKHQAATGQNKLPLEQSASFGMDVLDGTLGLLELHQRRPSSQLQVSPPSLVSLGSADFLLVRGVKAQIESKMMEKLRHLLQNGLKKKDDEIKTTAGAKPDLLERLDSLKGRAEALFPGILKQ